MVNKFNFEIRVVVNKSPFSTLLKESPIFSNYYNQILIKVNNSHSKIRIIVNDFHTACKKYITAFAVLLMEHRPVAAENHSEKNEQ